MAAERDSYDVMMKLLMVGDAGVGKSSILLRFTDDSFDDHLQSTIGVDFKVKVMEADGKRIKVTIWDTAGQERFRTLTSSYYRGAQAILMTYDVTNRDTFKNVGQWLQEVSMYCPGGGSGVVKVLVGNKVDMADRAVSKSEGEAYARSKGMIFIETSAKTTVGIKQVFEEAVHKVLENPALMADLHPSTARRDAGVRLDEAKSEEEAVGGCC